MLPPLRPAPTALGAAPRVAAASTSNLGEPMHIKILLGTVLALALVVGACGKKPKPRQHTADPAAATSAAPDRGPLGPGAVADKTAGGVSLAGAPQEVAQAASALARRQDSATRQLIAAGEPARPVARALLGSLNLPEVEGALAFFAAHPDEEALPDIARLVGHDAASVRQAARHALKGRHGSLLAQKIAPLTEDPRADVRVGAVRTLAGVGGLLARTALVARLADEDDTVVLEAASALSRLGPPADQPALDKLFANAEARPVQLRASLIVARRADGRVPAEAARRALASEDEALAAAAARAFPQTTYENTAAALAELSEDARPVVRRALLDGLVAVGAEAHRADIERLATAALAHEDVPLRVAGATALAALLPEAASKAARTTPIAPPPSDGEAPAAPAVAEVHFDPATFGPIPNRLLALLADDAPPLRRAAAVLLSDRLAGPITASRLDARVDEETDATTQQVVLSALARVRTRDAFERVIARLDSKPLGRMAHQALILAARLEIPRDAAAWRAWLERRFGSAVAGTTVDELPDETPPADGAPTDDPATANTDDPAAIPKAGEVEPLPDGTIPAHYDENGRWIPRKPPPLPPGYRKPDKQKPQLTNVPG